MARGFWFAPKGNLDIFHRSKFVGEGGGTRVNTTYSGFQKHTHVFDRSSFAPRETFGMFMQVEDATNEPPSRDSNTVYVSRPQDVCGEPSEPPSARTYVARDTEADTTFLYGEANPNGPATTYYFEWGLDAAYGQTAPLRNIGDGAVYQHPGILQTDLNCETAPHYRIVAFNPFGTTRGNDRSFTTGRCIDIFTDGLESGGLNLWSQDVQ